MSTGPIARWLYHSRVERERARRYRADVSRAIALEKIKAPVRRQARSSPRATRRRLARAAADARVVALEVRVAAPPR